MSSEEVRTADGGEPSVEASRVACGEVREQFPDYLDGALTGRAMQTLSAHLDACEACHAEFRGDLALQGALGGLGPARAPERLQTQLLAALAAERDRGTHLHPLARLRRDWRSSLAPVALRVSGGLAAAVVLLGSATLFFADNLPVQANDERMAHLMSPRYLYSSVTPEPIDRADPLLVDVKVDASGRVYDYSVIAGHMDAGSQLRVEENLLTSVYKPATLFGVPVRGHVMVTFSGVSVRG